MTINVSFDTVTNALEALSITGFDGKTIPIKDIDVIPENTLMLCPVISPLPAGFVQFSRPEISTFGTFGAEQVTLPYTLTYRYYHATIQGGMGGVFQVYSGLIKNIGLIAKAILSNDTLAGATNVRLDQITNVGPVQDPAGNDYHGCDFVIYVEQYTGA